MTEKEDTSSELKSAVSKLLRDKRYSKAAKTAAGLGLSRPLTPDDAATPLEREVRRFLRDSRYSKAAKKAAGLTMADPIDDHD